MKRLTILILTFFLSSLTLDAQPPDSSLSVPAIRVDSSKTSVVINSDSVINTVAGDTMSKVMRQYSPRAAAIRSAILPGLGQIYNKKYWKLPIVYGALGTSAGVFLYNMKWYRRTRFAFKVAFNRDTANFGNVHPKLQGFVLNGDAATLSYYRKQYRRDIDYSVIFFVVLWGLNVVDAAVDAHLKPFDVSPDLSLQLKPGYSDFAGTHGLTLALVFK